VDDVEVSGAGGGCEPLGNSAFADAEYLGQRRPINRRVTHGVGSVDQHQQ
jgi:hypothetical protein